MIRVAWAEPRKDGLTKHILKPGMDREHWVTADGHTYHVRGMGDDHLVNTIRMLRSRVPTMRQDEMIIFPPSGDAVYLTDEEWLVECVPPFAAMVREARSRGLDASRSPPDRAFEDLDEIFADPWGDS